MIICLPVKPRRIHFRTAAGMLRNWVFHEWKRSGLCQPAIDLVGSYRRHSERNSHNVQCCQAYDSKSDGAPDGSVAAGDELEQIGTALRHQLALKQVKL